MSVKVTRIHSVKMRMYQLITRITINRILKRKYVISPHEGYKCLGSENVEYIEITSQGVFDGKLSHAPEMIDKTFWAMLRRFIKVTILYAKEQSGNTVYWRIKPEVGAYNLTCSECNWDIDPKITCETCDIHENKKYNHYVGYMRLMIA